MLRPSCFYILLFFLISACVQNNKVERKSEQNIESQIDSSKIVIIPIDTLEFSLYKNVKPAILSSNDMINVDKVLRTCIDSSNKYTYNTEMAYLYTIEKL